MFDTQRIVLSVPVVVGHHAILPCGRCIIRGGFQADTYPNEWIRCDRCHGVGFVKMCLDDLLEVPNGGVRS